MSLVQGCFVKTPDAGSLVFALPFPYCDATSRRSLSPVSRGRAASVAVSVRPSLAALSSSHSLGHRPFYLSSSPAPFPSGPLITRHRAHHGAVFVCSCARSRARSFTSCSPPPPLVCQPHGDGRFCLFSSLVDTPTTSQSLGHTPVPGVRFTVERASPLVTWQRAGIRRSDARTSLQLGLCVLPLIHEFDCHRRRKDRQLSCR